MARTSRQQKHEHEHLCSDVSELFCEAHPELEWPHDGCGGAGMPRCAQVEALVFQRDLARRQRDALLAALKDCLRFFGETVDDKTWEHEDGTNVKVSQIRAAIALGEKQ